MGEPEKICDRVGIMFAGRLVQVGTPDELKHSVSELSSGGSRDSGSFSYPTREG